MADQTCYRSPHGNYNLLLVKLRLQKVLSGFVVVQTLIKKWIIFIAQKKHRRNSKRRFFLFSYNSRGNHLSSSFTFPISFKCRTTVEGSTLSYSATSRVFLSGSALINAFISSLSIAGLQLLCGSFSRLRLPARNL